MRLFKNKNVLKLIYRILIALVTGYGAAVGVANWSDVVKLLSNIFG